MILYTLRRKLVDDNLLCLYQAGAKEGELPDIDEGDGGAGVDAEDADAGEGGDDAREEGEEVGEGGHLGGEEVKRERTRKRALQLSTNVLFENWECG